MDSFDTINTATIPSTATDIKHDSLDQQQPTNSSDNQSDLTGPNPNMEDSPPITATTPIQHKNKQASCFRRYFGCLNHLCTQITRSFSNLKNHSREKQFRAAIQRIKQDQNYTVLLPPPTQPRKVLVLDLDETLIHTTTMQPSVYHFVSEVGINNCTKTIYTTKRKGLDTFLTQMGKLYEIIVFTASPRFYADRIIDHIDPQRIIAHRLYREHCIHYQKRMYLKNLRILGRDLNNVIFVDDNHLAQLLQPTTFYEIEPFYGKEDDHLEQLMTFLKHVHNREVACVGEERRKFQKMEMLKELEEAQKREEEIRQSQDRHPDTMKSTNSTSSEDALISNKNIQHKKSHFGLETAQEDI